MLDAENPNESTESTTGQEALTPPEATPAEEAAPAAKKTAAKRTTKKTAAKKTAAKKTTAKRTTKKAAAEPEAAAETVASEPAAGSTAPAAGTTDVAGEASGETPTGAEDADRAPTAKRVARKTTKKAAAKRTTKKTAAAPAEEPTPTEEPAPAAEALPLEETLAAGTPADETAEEAPAKAGPPPVAVPLFQPPDPSKAVVTTRKRSAKKAAAAKPEPSETGESTETTEEKPARKTTAKRTSKKAAEPAPAEETEEVTSGEADEEREDEQGGERRRRRRGGRRRRRSGGGEDGEAESTEPEGPTEKAAKADEAKSDEGEEGAGGTRRRRRRRRPGEGDGEEAETTTSSRARKPRNAEDEITALSGSTRLEAKKQRRREGREAGRRRAPIVSEAEFLARRESVDRVMVIRQREDLTQIAVLEDKVLVEHYVARESQTSLIGNVYLGRVQNVLPSMEAAFIDIGKGRNAVLYAGEVNWEALGAKNGQPRKIEQVLKSGQPILVQVTKDPVGHKGARLTSQVSLPGRFLVYVPDGTTSGISRKLPDTERNRLKSLLKEIVPESAGVIVRTAAEGASEDELTRDVERLTARWSDIEAKVKTGNAPQLLYGEPDLTLKVVRDLFTEDFKKLVVAGDDAWDMVEGYVDHVAPDLAERLEKYDGERDVFAEYRIDEQIEKALDRKVWLPSGGSLVIDRTEAMTVVDVNTGKFTGSGGNLEETVTKNNLESAEEIVRQLRLRDIGGIIVVDFIDMVLESNRDLVLRRLVECLGRDRTRHQVAEVTSLGLVQMTRKRIGTGLLEAFSESCEHCQGRGLILHHEPVEPKKKGDDDARRGRRSGRSRGRDDSGGGGVPSPKDVAAMSRQDDATGEAAAEPAAAEPTSGKGEDRGAKTDGRGTKPEPETRAAGADQGEPAAAPAGDEAGDGTGADQQAAEGGEGKPSRSRGGRGRGRSRGRSAQAGEESQAEQTAAEPAAGQAGVPETAPGTTDAGTQSEVPSAAEPEAPAAQTPVEPAEPEAPAEPAAPKVVTTVRRRARRAAGPPTSEAGATAPSPNGNAPAPTGASVGAGAEADVDEPGDVDPIATLVEDAEVDQDAADSSADATDGAEVEASTTPHVPVKKRGARRR